LRVIDEPNVYFDLRHDRQPLSDETTANYDFLDLCTSLAFVGLKVPPSQKTIVDSEAGANPSTGGSLTTQSNQEDQDIHSYIPSIFGWLRETKDVTSVLKVVVQDNQDCPCRDDAIEKALQKLNVRYLDWNKIDLCSETIYRAAPDVKDLWLYSSGKNAVLRGWAQSDGLGKLSNVCAHESPPKA
jgi:hypothetical protein